MKRVPRLPTVIISLAVVLIGWQLMLPPVVGLANNGDFGKILGNFGLGALEEHEFVFADTKYDFHSRYFYKAGFSSSEMLLVVPSLALSAILSRNGRFDLRYVGLIHGVLFLIAIVLFVPLLAELEPWARYGLGFAVLFVFGDVAYASYLNSFYMDVAAYLSLLLAAALYLRVLRWRRRRDWILLVISCLLLVTSKPQHAALGFPIALLFLAQKEETGTKRAVWAAVGLALAGTSVICLRYAAPPWYKATGCFTVLFYQVLPNARDADRTLDDLGLDSSYRKYIGKHAYMDRVLDDPELAKAITQRVSYSRLAGFFVSHPRDAYVALKKSLSEAGRQRPALGNYDSHSGMAPWAESQAFALFSSWKRHLFFGRGTRYLLCLGLLIFAVAALLAAERRTLPLGIVPGGMALIVMTIVELAVSSFGDAIDIPRHHLLFYELSDLLLLAALYLAVRAGPMLMRPPDEVAPQVSSVRWRSGACPQSGCSQPTGRKPLLSPTDQKRLVELLRRGARHPSCNTISTGRRFP